MSFEDLLCGASALGWNYVEDAIVYDLLNFRESTNCYPKGGVPFLDSINAADSVKLFRFEKNDLPVLKDALGIPDKIRTHNRFVTSGVDGLAILLRRLAYPNRLSDLEKLFQKSSPALSSISNEVMRIIQSKKGRLLMDLNNLSFLNEDKLEYYSEAIQVKGAPMDNCFGFIDGTARAICRPTVAQREYFSGHKRFHCLKYQSVLAPDGIILSLHGPYSGKRHDSGILRESMILEQLRNKARGYVLYGDSGYPCREQLLRPYIYRGKMTDQERRFNSTMSSLRQTVEWGFGKIVQEFAFIDFNKNQKIMLQEVAEMYKTAVILANCQTCLYGSQTAAYFGTLPPSLTEYLNTNAYY